MKNILQQNLVTFIIRFLLFTFMIASISIYWENTYVEECALATYFGRATAKAWVDENMNQVWDENEPPLAGMPIIMINTNQVCCLKCGINPAL